LGYSNALKLGFITDDLRDLVSRGPELGVLQNKMHGAEALKPRIARIIEDADELLKSPPPSPKPEIKIKMPKIEPVCP